MPKRKIIKLILAIFFFLAGIELFIYPRITDSIYKNKVKELEKEFTIKINDISNDDNSKLNELYNLLKEENNKVYLDGEKRFLSDKTYDITDINLADYGIEDNIFGFLDIPTINMTLPIYFGASEANMLKGATHLTGTSYPIGGVNTNSVIAGHRGYFKTEMLRNIDKIKIGDKIYLKTVFGTLEYEAIKAIIIKPTDLAKLTIVEGEDMVTLVSCHPFPTTRERYVLYFKRV